ncbi:MAG TPA: ribonuclease J [Polyangiaceae bacterium]
MSAVRVIPLGGLGEIGMNALAVEQGGDAILVDCGVTFDDRGLGVDVIHPDFAPLDALRVRGVVLTHGHEDHIGALPYLLRRHDVPIWGPPYALGLVRERLAEFDGNGAAAAGRRGREHGLLGWARLIPTSPGERFEVGPFRVEPVRVTHSIADATALLIETAAGTIVHTGDFKFDEEPVDGEAFDEARLRAAGDAGVSLLLSDSTNVDARGDAAGGEKGVGDALRGIIEGARGAVVVAMFASNVHRLKMLGDIARATHRRIVVLGRSVHTHARVAHATGYLDWPGDVTWPADRVRELPRDRILGIATGTQAEARAALARLSRGEHPAFDLLTGDTVILSSRVIPGHEPEVYALMGDLIRRGVDLRTWISDRNIHVSGHAHAGEQRRMIELVRPRSFVPVHGTLHHLHRHAELARGCGIGDVLVLENGDVGVLDEHGVRKDGRVNSGRVHVWAGREVAPAVLRERQSMAEEGVVFAVVRVDGRGDPAGEITLSTRGVLDEKASEGILTGARRDALDALRELPRSLPQRPNDDASIAEAVRLAVRRSFARALGFKPMAIVEVVRVAG